MLLYSVRVFLYSFIAASAINVSFPILLLFSSFLSLLPLSPLLPLSSNPPTMVNLRPPSSPSLPLLPPSPFFALQVHAGHGRRSTDGPLPVI